MVHWSPGLMVHWSPGLMVSCLSSVFVVPVGEGAEGGAAAEGASRLANCTVEGAEPELLQPPPPAPHKHFFSASIFLYTMYKLKFSFFLIKT